MSPEEKIKKIAHQILVEIRQEFLVSQKIPITIETQTDNRRRAIRLLATRGAIAATPVYPIFSAVYDLQATLNGKKLTAPNLFRVTPQWQMLSRLLEEYAPAKRGGDSLNTRGILPPNPTTLYYGNGNELWKEPKEQFCYRIQNGSNRQKIMDQLMARSGYVKSISIANALSSSTKSIQNSIRDLNLQAKKRLQLGCGALIEGFRGSGYRINPNYTIKTVSPS